jgi:hypothetical protein
MVWVEDVRIREASFVMVKTPCIDEDYGVLGDFETIDVVVCTSD